MSEKEAVEVSFDSILTASVVADIIEDTLNELVDLYNERINNIDESKWEKLDIKIVEEGSGIESIAKINV